MKGIGRFYSPPEFGAPGRRARRGRRRDLFLAGLFLLFSGALLFWVAVMVSDGLGRSYPLTAEFEQAPGLKPGAAVEQGGYLIGSVSAVEPLFEADGMLPRFFLRLRIRQDWRLPEDSIATIASAGPLEGNVVKIIPGGSNRALAPGGRIVSGGVSKDMLAHLTDLTGYLRELVDETVKPMLVSLNRQVQALEGVLAGFDAGLETTKTEEPRSEMGGGNQNLRNIVTILENMRQVSADLRSQVAAVDPGSVGRVVSAAESSADDVDRLVDSIEARTRDMEAVMQEYMRLAESMNGLVKRNEENVEESLVETRYLLQELGSALHPILGNIEGATRNLLELSRDLRDNPAVVIGGRKKIDNTPLPEQGGEK